MDKILKRHNLFNEILSQLSYQDIARCREVSKDMRHKIDSFSVWEQVIKRDYPYLVYIEEITKATSLSIIASIAKNKQIVPQSECLVGVIGSLGKINTYINEPDHLMRAGLLGSLSMYVSNHGVSKISLVSIPNMKSARSQLRITQVYLLLCDASVDDWQEKLISLITDLNDSGIFRLVIFANIDKLDTLLEDLIQRYPVVCVRNLTLQNVKILLTVLDAEINSSQNQNVVPMMTEEENKKKKKCSIF